MADFDQDRFDISLEKFFKKLESLTDSVGRSGGSSSGKGSGTVPRAKASDPAQKANQAELDKATKAIRKLGDEVDDAIDVQKELTKEQEKAKRAQERTTEAFKDLGQSMLSADANLSNMFGRFSTSLSYTGTTFGKIAGGMAMGVGYAIGSLQEFAKQAGEMGAFADLDKFSVGSVAQMKLMSGLGGAFMKVIENSNGTFRAFGATSQEAAENLSNLSRGLKYGSGYLNNTLRNALGKDLVKSVDRAARAARSMGITDEEQAKLTGDLAVTAAMGAKDEQDAKQKLVEQYAKTMDVTKTLNSAFGISAKAALAAAEAFRKTDAGTFAARGGMTAETAALAKLAQDMGVALDPEKAARFALGVAQGDQAGAIAALGGGMAQENADVLLAAINKAGGIGDMGAVAANLKNMGPEMERIIQQAQTLAVNRPELAAPGAALARFKAGMDTAKPGEEPKPRTSETDNIMAMNSLTAALESLRNVIMGVTAGIATLVGSLGAIAVAGGIGGILKGGLGSKMGDIFGGLKGMFGKKGGPAAGSMSGWKSGPSAMAQSGGGIMDKLSGAAGKGMEGFGEMLGKLGESKTVKGAGTLALLGGALALTAVGLKTFNEVNWTSLVKGTIALGGLIGMARLVGEATTGIVKGAAAIALLGAAVLVSAVGFKTFNDVNWDSLVKGTIAIGALAAMAKLLGSMTSSILMGAAAIVTLGASMWVAGKGFKSFNDVNWDSVFKGGLAIGALAVTAKLLGTMTPSLLMGALGVAALGAAMWVAGKGFQAFNDLDWEGIAKGVVALAAFGVVAATIGAFVVPILLGAAAIAGLGVALGIFGAGAYVAGQAADVFATAIQKVGDVDGVNLIAVGAGLAAVGAGAVVFAAGMVAATATSLVTGLMSLFGAKSPIDRILALVPVADKISMVGQGMMNFGSGIGLINENLQALDLDALEKFKNVLVEMSNIDLPSLDGLSIPQISTAGLTGEAQSGSTLSNVLAGNTAVTPEVIGQLMSYLSSIENDLAAIRGNTRKNGYESPVRLS
jgi:hypothetical protein